VRAPRVFQTENGALEESLKVERNMVECRAHRRSKWWNLEEQTWDINDGAVGHLSSVRACPSPFKFSSRRVPI
jgi:hypothetical protein